MHIKIGTPQKRRDPKRYVSRLMDISNESQNEPKDTHLHTLLLLLLLLLLLVIKSRRLRWAGHVARMKEGRSAFKILTGKPTARYL